MQKEVLCSQKIKALDCQKREFKEESADLNLELSYKAMCKVCAKSENFYETGRQTDMEKMWQKSKSGLGTSTFVPHMELPHIEQGPTSLPVELVSNAQKEVKRLQELRRYIQEECDQLLLKKDRLKEEVGEKAWHA